ncbi:MAG TPA: hypothetical protein VLA49_03270 [Anaerolineales bacterium]|nr:hypothetical protein [Anaerolineales bacterium]
MEKAVHIDGSFIAEGARVPLVKVRNRALQLGAGLKPDMGQGGL